MGTTHDNDECFNCSSSEYRHDSEEIGMFENYGTSQKVLQTVPNCRL